MDFEKLSKILPKHPETWSVEEIGQWLEFVELKQLQQTFKNASIDGSCILLLEEHDLKNDLQITSQIWVKKILNWTKKGLKEYANFLLNKENQYEMMETEQQPLYVKANSSNTNYEINGKSMNRKSFNFNTNHNIHYTKPEPTILLDKQYSINQMNNINNNQLSRVNYQVTSHIHHPQSVQTPQQNNYYVNAYLDDVMQEEHHGACLDDNAEDFQIPIISKQSYEQIANNPFKTQNALAAELGYQQFQNIIMDQNQNLSIQQLQKQQSQNQSFIEDILVGEEITKKINQSYSMQQQHQQVINYNQIQQQQSQQQQSQQQQFAAQAYLPLQPQQIIQPLQMPQNSFLSPMPTTFEHKSEFNQQSVQSIQNYEEPQLQQLSMQQQQSSNQQQIQGQQQPQLQQNPQILQKQTSLEIENNNMLANLNAEQELIIQPTEGIQTTFYCIKQSGGKIGRHSSNQMVILEESVSRFHADIFFTNNQFYIKDIGSTTGTFIKITSNLPLKEGYIIEMGSNHFLVEKISFSNNLSECVLNIIEGPNQNDHIYVKLKDSKETFTIGRKSTNQLSIQDDQHLSNSHASIYLCDNQFIVEDLSSTNGSWKRLSPEGQPSEPYLLSDQTIFKIGTTSTFQVNVNSNKYKLFKKMNSDGEQLPYSNNECVICYENERDALYYPCRHNTACIKCSMNLVQCPICKVSIQEKIKIYKS